MPILSRRPLSPRPPRPNARRARAAALGVVLSLGAGGAWGGCGSLGILEDSHVLPASASRAGVAGAVFMPLEHTVFQPDGPTRDASSGKQNLAYLPLPHVIGWYRRGLGDRVEVRTSFQVPSFAIAVSGKLGLVGPRAGAPFALALSAEAGASPVLLGALYGATVHVGVAVGPAASLDLTARYGVAVGLNSDPGLTAGLGVNFGRLRRYHVALGAHVPLPRGGSPLGVWLAVGSSR